MYPPTPRPEQRETTALGLFAMILMACVAVLAVTGTVVLVAESARWLLR